MLTLLNSNENVIRYLFLPLKINTKFCSKYFYGVIFFILIYLFIISMYQPYLAVNAVNMKVRTKPFGRSCGDCLCNVIKCLQPLFWLAGNRIRPVLQLFAFIVQRTQTIYLYILGESVCKFESYNFHIFLSICNRFVSICRKKIVI